jgi:mRNA-degrading endonuclease RelE of RelBE toxin-antitoxin system
MSDRAFARRWCGDAVPSGASTPSTHSSFVGLPVGDWRILFELDRKKQLIVITGVRRRASNTY